MKAQFLKMAGVNSEDEFYNMYPTEDVFFQNYPEARQMAHGGATYPYPGQATADQFFNYGMQGRGSGSQIPVESYYAYGGSSNGPLGYFDDGGSAWNYGQFPAFAKQGTEIQGGNIDATTSSRLNNFLVGINKNVDDNITKEALAQISQAYPMAQYGMQQSTYDPNMFGADMYQQQADRQNQGNMDAFGNAWNTLGQSATYKAQKQMTDKLTDYFKKNTKKKQTDTSDTSEIPTYQPTTMRAGNSPVGPQFTPFDQSFIDMNQNYYQRGGTLPKHQVAPGQTGPTGATGPTGSQENTAPTGATSNKTPVEGQTVKERIDYLERLINSISDVETPSASEKVLPNGEIIQLPSKIITVPDNKQKLINERTYLFELYGIQLEEANKQYTSVRQPKLSNKDVNYISNIYTTTPAGESVVGELENFKTTPDRSKKATGTGAKTTGTPGIGGGKKPGTIIPTTGSSAAEAQSTGQAAGTPATKTTTSMIDQSEEERRKAAAYSLVSLYGGTPEQQEQYWQSIKNSMTGAASGTPYGYVGQYNVPYKYKRRGYSPYPMATDTGYFPTGTDVQGWISQAVAAGANPEDVQVKVKDRPFGMGRKIVFKANFNPETGKVENKPEVEATPSTPAPSPMLTPQDRYNLDKEQAIREGIDYEKQKQIQEQAGIPLNEPVIAPEGWYKHGGLHRFLPKAQAGMMTPEGTFSFDNLDINIPIASQLGNAYQKGKGFVDSAKEFTRNIGPDFKVVGKDQAGINLSPYAGQGVMAGMRLAERFAENRNAPDYEKEAAIRRIAPFTSVGTDKGDYSPTGAPTGQFRPNDKTYAFNTGNMGSIPGRIMDRGGSTAYSDWSQTPVNGYYGVPQGEFNPYSQWSQAPVMQTGGIKQQQAQYEAFTQTPEWHEYQDAKRIHSGQRIRTAKEKVPLWIQNYKPVSSNYIEGYNPLESYKAFQTGGAMMQDGVYDLTEDEINEIIQMGGQVEFLD